jgi:hypothetical protein
MLSDDIKILDHFYHNHQIVLGYEAWKRIKTALAELAARDEICSCCQAMDGERRLKALGITNNCPKCGRKL